MASKTQISIDLHAAQRLLASLGSGTYRGDLGLEAGKALRVSDEALSMVSSLDLRGQLQRVQVTLRTLCVGGLVDREQCKQAVYALHLVLVTEFRACRRTAEPVEA